MSKGTIYYDENSRGRSHIGKQGRWVGERTEHGKRVRMRSSDYNKVLAWVQGLQGEKVVPLRDMPQYSVDVEKRMVRNRWGKVLKGYKECGRTVYQLNNKGQKHCISWERIAYAVMNDVEVMKIPSDLVIKESDGKYFLQHTSEFHTIKNQCIRKEKLLNINKILKRRIMELEMLQRFYQTRNTAEIVTYASKDIFEGMVFHIVNRYRYSMQHATDIVTDATEQYLQNLTTGTKPAISISSNIRGLCQKVIAKGARNISASRLE